MSENVTNFVRENCSPTKEELSFAQNEYELIQSLLEGTVFQTGSYARATTTSPLNDIDVFWPLSKTIEKAISSEDISISKVLEDLATKLRSEYLAVGKKVTITSQSHSVMIEFPDREQEFSLDIIPAIELGEKNTFGDSLYRIPEVGLMSKSKRRKYYESLGAGHLKWIKTDPKGYKEAAKRSSNSSAAFRPATRLIKKWRSAWKKKKNFGKVEFKLKSFHLELLVQQVCDQNPSMPILQVIYELLENFEKSISHPQILDRAQENSVSPRYIDAYLADLTDEERNMITIAYKSAKILVQPLLNDSNADKSDEYLHRLINGEEFISAYGYDYSNPIKDTSVFSIDGMVRKKEGFVSGWLKEAIPLQRGLTRGSNTRKIDFRVKKAPEGNYLTYWKVRNTGQEAKDSNQLRGEINKDHTLNTPEKTSYVGTHYVTCYLVDSNSRKVVAENSAPVKII